MKTDYDIIISGGGVVGATFACALGGGSLKVALIESQLILPVQEGQDLRVSAITPASRTVFENIGAWEGMGVARHGRIEAMHIWEGGNALNFNSADIGEPGLAWIVENRLLVSALWQRLGQFSNITLLCPAKLNAIEIGDAAVSTTLGDGRRIRARLLVGADGADSQVRKAAGIDWNRHDLGQAAIVATVQVERAHENIARQHFLPTGPLAFLPLVDAHIVSIVWSADSERARTLMALDDAAFENELQTAFGASLGTLKVRSERIAIPLALGFAQAYTAHRVALIGDAAHTVHPLAGQGVNLGILDAVTLAETLSDAAMQRRDLGAHGLLRRYERARKGANLGMQAVTGGLRYVFGNSVTGIRGLGSTGLGLSERLPGLKNFLMRRASGLDGELPRLARRHASNI